MSETRPTLDDLLNDPMVLMVIKRSRSQPEEVRLLMREAEQRSARRPDMPPAHIIAATRSNWCCA